jgi:hypothetical protein
VEIAVRNNKKSCYPLLRFLCYFAFLVSSLAQSFAPLPKIEGENLSGHKVVLPDAAAGKVAVLIFGFTKASKLQTGAWADTLQADFVARTDVLLYQLPVLEDVPRILRSIVISGIRKGVAENKRDRFIPVLQGEADLKKLVHYKEPDDAYLVVLDRAGSIVQQMHGAFNDANYGVTKMAIDSLLNRK